MTPTVSEDGEWSWASLPGVVADKPPRCWTRFRDECSCYPKECDHRQTIHIYLDQDEGATLWIFAERRPEVAS